MKPTTASLRLELKRLRSRRRIADAAPLFVREPVPDSPRLFSEGQA